MGTMAEALKKAGLVSERKAHAQEVTEKEQLKRDEESTKYVGVFAGIEEKERKKEERDLKRAAHESKRRSNSRDSKQYLERFK